MSDATTYDGLVTILAGLCVVPTNDPDFQTELPDALAYANNRMCRDIDFLTTRTAQSGPTLSVGVGTFTLSGIAQIVVLENLAVITPAGQISPLTRQTESYIETMYPYSWIGFPAPTSARGLPVDFSLLDGLNVFIGPAPDLSYRTYMVGTFRPAPPSSINESPWILQNLPDVFVTAAMVRLSGYLKNYAGATSDDPNQPVSWESQYTKLLEGTAVEEARKFAQSSSWSDQKPRQTSTPPRQ